jgi:hypothetical protein
MFRLLMMDLARHAVHKLVFSNFPTPKNRGLPQQTAQVKTDSD